MLAARDWNGWQFSAAATNRRFSCNEVIAYSDLRGHTASLCALLLRRPADGQRLAGAEIRRTWTRYLDEGVPLAA